MRDVIFYDEACFLCNRVLRWVAYSDKKGKFHFAPISLRKKMYPEAPGHESSNERPTTIWVIDKNGNWISESRAVLYIAGRIGGIWNLLQVGHILPHSIQDKIYRWVSRNRYKFNVDGQLVCPIPPQSIRERIIVHADDED